MRLCSTTGKSDCTSKVKLGPPRGHKPQLEKKRDTPFQKPRYQELSRDTKAPSRDLAKTFTYLLHGAESFLRSCLQLVKKLPAFHGVRRFITALTSVRHLSLSCASPMQSIYPHPTSWRSVLILSTHLRLGLPSGLLRSAFPTKTLYTPSPHPYAPHAQPISLFLILSPSQYWARSTDNLALRYAISSIPPFPLIYFYSSCHRF